TAGRRPRAAANRASPLHLFPCWESRSEAEVGSETVLPDERLFSWEHLCVSSRVKIVAGGRRARRSGFKTVHTNPKRQRGLPSLTLRVSVPTASNPPRQLPGREARRNQSARSFSFFSCAWLGAPFAVPRSMTT